LNDANAPVADYQEALKKFSKYQTQNPNPVGPTEKDENSVGAAKMPAAALAALARINSRLNLKPKESNDKHVNAPARALAAAEEIRKQLQQQSKKDENTGPNDMNLDESGKADPSATGDVREAGANAQDEGPSAPDGVNSSASNQASKEADGITPSGGDVGASANSSNVSKYQAPPSNEQFQPGAEEAPITKPAVADQPQPCLPLPSI